MRLWPSKRKTVHFCISSCFLTVTQRLHRLGPGIFISPKFTLYICRKTAGINYTRIYSIYSHSRNVCLCLFQALQASTAWWLPLYGQSSETTTIPIVDDEATTMQKIKTEESWKNGPRIQERDFPDHGFMDDFGMILGWFWDDFGMILWMTLGWFCDDFGMILWWFWDDFGMILGWFWDDFVMMLGWFCDDFGMICDDFGMICDDFGMICDDNKLKQYQKNAAKNRRASKLFGPSLWPGLVVWPLAWFPPCLGSIWGWVKASQQTHHRWKSMAFLIRKCCNMSQSLLGWTHPHLGMKIVIHTWPFIHFWWSVRNHIRCPSLRS